MTHPVLGVDHTYLLVHDLEVSAALYRRLGFTLSPRGLHSPEKGTANHTVIFSHDYLELLGVVRETSGNRLQRDRLADQGEGVQAIANRTESADKAKTGLVALGIATGEVSAFSRPLPLPDGTDGRASFRTLSFDPTVVPLGHFFLCQHETSGLVWRPELQTHENGAIALGGIIGISSDPRATAEVYARFYAEGRVIPAEGGFRVDTGKNSAPLLFLERKSAEHLFAGQNLDATPRGGYAALRIIVDAVDKTKRVLAAPDVPFVLTERRSVIVGPEFTSGTIIEFIGQ
ncbi:MULTISPECIES: VOC family protein [unclassified Sinorhizobium]|uniref:VOC family protein n=1 Tax=unclassified Sinorhizobium TaxID=2613772 RepID=UPI00352682E6